MSSTTLTDFSRDIRAEIERRVIAARNDFESRYGWEPTSLSLGYLFNSHHGHPLYQVGDKIAGVEIDSITWRADWCSGVIMKCLYMDSADIE